MNLATVSCCRSDNLPVILNLSPVFGSKLTSSTAKIAT
ncbi:hypothetical protein AB395_00005815 (plasmid) [Sinorhizobium fredii CCBAU 45436]|nr:hypothetical protein AB395_00005815 [Sinorhizobium fredii CCBAU 45436]